MKKLLFIIPVLLCTFLFSSCYTSKVAHGGMSFEEPMVKVQSQKNQIILWGLAPLKSDQEAKKYVGDKKEYVTKTQHTFIDGLLSFITFGIYTPTTTTYYLPFNR